MNIWAIADPHLSFGTPDKEMVFFGEQWQGYTDKLETNWRQLIAPDDLVLIAGDISWAMNIENALPDLNWLAALPGKKIISKGNHDYWWTSLKKMKTVAPPEISFIHNNALSCPGVSIGGTRLWDNPDFSFGAYIEKKENVRERTKAPPERDETLKFYERELQRLEISLKEIDPNADLKIAMLHYPPVGADLAPSAASDLLERYGIDICVFGHLHNVRKDALPFGEARGIKYYLTSCDYLDFKPVKIAAGV